MPYKLTYEPLNRMPGQPAKAAVIETAAAAWRELDGLMRSDEKVKIKILHPYGHEIGWQELREIAKRKNN